MSQLHYAAMDAYIVVKLYQLIYQTDTFKGITIGVLLIQIKVRSLEA